MAQSQFDQFLREVLKLPMVVFEGPSFGYTEQAARGCFAQQVSVKQMCDCSGFNGVGESPLCCASTEKGLAQHIPGYVDVRPASSVSGVVAAHASARQRGERWEYL